MYNWINILECNQEKFFFMIIWINRRKSTCINGLGSFSCECSAGYGNFTPYEGCSDIDDCLTGIIHGGRGHWTEN